LATDRKVSTELEKLDKLVSAVAEGMTQLQLEVAKMAARIGAMDDQIGSIGRRLDRDSSAGDEQDKGRDRALEQEVFGQFGTRRRSRRGEKASTKTRKPGAPVKRAKPCRAAAKRNR
jgi:hypothetical protein